MRRTWVTPLLAATVLLLGALHVHVAASTLTVTRPLLLSVTVVPTDLESLHGEYVVHKQWSSTPFRPANTLLSVVADRVMIDAVASGNVDALKADLQALGMQDIVVFGRTISGRLPMSAIGALSALPDLRFARPALATKHMGLVTSQGDKAMRADVARTTFGIDGTGVSVGVVSDSFNCLGGAATDVANGDLSPVTVVQDLPGCASGTDEGRAMLQLIHDVAPGASLLFATGFTGQAGFASNILSLAAAGADVIVDDVGYFAEPMFQDGIIAQAVETVVASGVAYFSSAGNSGRAAYQAGFANSGLNLGTPESPFFAHDFDPAGAVDFLQTVTLPPGTTVISFQWSDPFFSVSGPPGAQTDLDIALFSIAGDFLGGSFGSNIGGDPVEILIINNPNSVAVQAQIAIGKFAGPNPALMKYIASRSTFTIDQFATNSGTIYGHANAAGAEAVGAAAFFDTPEFGVSPPVLEAFSSRGTTPILFTTAGVATFDARATKPGIVAPDGTNTTFFGADIPQDADTFGNFFGTSAAAPHAAAVAALLLDAVPTLTPSAVFAALRSTAIDMGAPGFDNDSGFGLIRADAAIASVLPVVTIVATDAAAGETGPDLGTFTVTRTGATTAALTVTYTITGSATSGSDYTALPGSVTIPAGAASASINVVPIDDAVIAEGNETVVVTLAAGTGYLVGTPSADTVTIADNDPVVVTVVATNPSASETGPNTGTFTVSRTGPTGSALTVTYTVGGSATAGSDYTALSGSVVISAGSASALVVVTPIDDAVIGEGDETVVLTLAAGAGYTVGTPSSDTVTIADNDPVVVTIVATDPSASETGPNTGTFTVSRTGPTGSALTVNYTVTGSATAGSDYTALSGSVVIAAGAASALVVVTPIDDAVIGEGDETVVLTLAAGTGYVVGTPAWDTVTIADNDPVVVTVVATDPSASETGPNTGTFTVSRTGPTTAALTVNYTVAGTATADSDYTALPGSVVIPAGAASALVVVTPIDDAVVPESAETVVLTLAAGTGYTVGASSVDTVTITDNDAVALTCDVPVTGTISSPTESDLFSFSVADGEIVRITVVEGTPSGANFLPQWRLLTAAGQPAASCGTFDIAQTRDCGPLAATGSPYRIEVADHLLDDTGTYHVHFQRLTLPCDSPELTCDLPVVGTISHPAESDLFSFNVAEGEVVRITVVEGTPSGANFLPMWRLLTAAGQPATACGAFDIAQTRDCGPLAAAGSPYRIEVADHLLDDTGTYHVHFQRLTLPCDGPALTCDIPATGTITDPAESDLHSLTVAEGEIVRITVVEGAPSGANFLPQWRLLTAAGLPAAACGTFDIAQTRDCGPLAAAGSPYRIEVADHLLDDTGTYHIHFQRLTLPCDSPELTCDIPVAGTISNPAESDLFSVNVAEGEVIRISVIEGTPSGANFLPMWRLLTAAGQPATACGAFDIAQTRDCGPLAAAGSPYRIEVADHLLDDTGAYQVLFQRLTLPCGAAAVVTIVASDPTATEAGSTTGTFTVTRTGATTAALTVNYTVTGTATAGSDYTALAGSVTIAAGSASASIVVTPIDDAVVNEPDETVVVTLAAGAGYTVGVQSSDTVTIADNDLVIVTIVATDSTASEAGPNTGTFTVSRTGPTSSALTVSYTVAGTATAGSDYIALTGSVTIAAGSASALVVVTPIDDAVFAEGTETVVVTLAAASGYTIGTPSSGSVTIADNDLPTVTLRASDTSAAEAGSATGAFTVTRTGPTTAALTVTYTVGGTASAGSDYTALAGSVIIPAGAKSALITVTPVDDALVEAAETVVLTLNPSATYIVGSPNTGTVTIADNDRATVTIRASDASATEAGPTTGAFTVTRTAVSPPVALTVHYAVAGSATSGSDYVALSGTVVIPAGANSATITVTPVDNAVIESAETVVVTLSANAAYIVGSAKTATVTIADNDRPTVTIRASDASATEAGPTTGVFTVTRTAVSPPAALTVHYTVSGSATPGSDYVALSGTVVIPAGANAAVITVTPINDVLVEAAEKVVVTLSANAAYIVGTPKTATVSITSND